MKKALINDTLARLNDTNNGSKKFELFCHKLILLAIDKKFLPASGSDAGGDGGIDGWSLSDERRYIKYAFSINKDVKRKIESEFKNTNWDRYQEVRFFTNQPIKSSEKEKYYEVLCEKGKKKLIIYDLEDIVHYVNQYPILGESIDLPRIQSDIIIDYLRDHNQLCTSKHSIEEYIPRKIKVLENRTWHNTPLSDYFDSLPVLTVFQAPAGFGKTCTLQQFHQEILFRNIDILLPPVFIALSDYTRGNLKLMIDDGMSANGDYRSNDYLLLLDGYDEVKDSERETLVKEIAQLIKHTNSTRKVIITVRENTYRLRDFKAFTETKTISFSTLTNSDITELFKKKSVSMDDKTVFFNSNFFREFSDNIFYVIKFISYYKLKGSIAGNMTDLLSYIVEQEIERLFKKEKPDESALESLAFYMSINQLLVIKKSEESKIENLFNFKLPSIPFKFSHKSIQEYLAGRKIAKQPIDTIKQIIAKGNLILPHMNDIIGFMLNILNTEKRFTDFEALIEWSLKGKGNAKRLVQIEADKIDPTMNHQIFKAVMKQESVSGSVFDPPASLVSFCLKEEKVNINYLVEAIILFKDSDNYHYHNSVLQSIASDSPESIRDDAQNKLVDFFITLLSPENIEKNNRLIKSLFCSIALFSSINHRNIKDINIIFDRLLSLKNHTNVINNLCHFLIIAEYPLDFNGYLKLYDKIRNNNDLQMAVSLVPEQTSDDTYHEPMQVMYCYNFVLLTRNFLAKEPSQAWKIILHTRKRKSDISEGYPTSCFNVLNDVFIDALKSCIQTDELNDKRKAFFVEWIVYNMDHYNNSNLFQNLTKTFNTTTLSEIVNDVVLSAKYSLNIPKEIIDFTLNEMVKIETDFDFFFDKYGQSENKLEKDFFDIFCRNITKKHNLYNYVFSKIPNELKETIIESRKNVDRMEREKKEQECLYKESIHIAFNQKQLLEEIQSIFNLLGPNEIMKDAYWDCDINKKFSEKNQFALYLFRTTFGEEKESIKQDDLIKYISVENWKWNFMIELTFYIDMHKLNYGNLSVDEKKKCVEWVKMVLNKHPIDNADSTLYIFHSPLIHFLRVSDILVDDIDFMNSYTDKFIGITFSALSNVLDGVTIVSYDSYSLEYLEKYFCSEMLLAFICEHFEQAYSHPRKMMSICGYIFRHLEKLFPYQKDNIKKGITKYLTDNLDELHDHEITDCAFSVGFSITDIDKERLADAFSIENNDFKHSIAASFLSAQWHKNSDVESNHLLEALKIAFDKTPDEFYKKTIAEYYISMNSKAGEIFLYYADYLLSDDSHPISTKFIKFGASWLYTSDIAHLEKVTELYKYSKKRDKSERRDGIESMALKSYKAIAENTYDHKELESVLSSMKRFVNMGYDYRNILIQEIENSFAERTYQPLSIDEILELV